MSSAAAPSSSRTPGAFGQAAVTVASLVAMSAALSLVVAASGDSSKARALVFPPWIAAESAVAAALSAGHRPLRTGISARIVIVAPRMQGEAEAAWPAGAWFMLNLDGLFGCLDRRSEALR